MASTIDSKSPAGAQPREESSASPGAERPLQPFTERVIARLPGPWLIWALVWAGIWGLEVQVLPLLLPGLRPLLGESVLESFAVFYTNLIALWGVHRLTRDVAVAAPAIARLTGGTATTRRVFAGFDNVLGPVVLSVAIVLLFVADELLRTPSWPVIMATLLALVAWAPVPAMIWAVGSILIGLHRLGAMPLQLRPFEEDRSLGLRALGSMAFTPFLILVAAVLPQLLTTGDDARDWVLNIATLAGGVVLLLAPLLRLRRQMLAAKREHAAWARGLYAKAVEAVRSGDPVDALRAQAAELQAAESLERHAAAIQEWPFDETLLRTGLAILTSIATAILARLVLAALRL